MKKSNLPEGCSCKFVVRDAQAMHLEILFKLVINQTCHLGITFHEPTHAAVTQFPGKFSWSDIHSSERFTLCALLVTLTSLPRAKGLLGSLPQRGLPSRPALLDVVTIIQLYASLIYPQGKYPRLCPVIANHRYKVSPSISSGEI